MKLLMILLGLLAGVAGAHADSPQTAAALAKATVQLYAASDAVAEAVEALDAVDRAALAAADGDPAARKRAADKLAEARTRAADARARLDGAVAPPASEQLLAAYENHRRFVDASIAEVARMLSASEVLVQSAERRDPDIKRVWATKRMMQRAALLKLEVDAVEKHHSLVGDDALNRAYSGAVLASGRIRLRTLQSLLDELRGGQVDFDAAREYALVQIDDIDDSIDLGIDALEEKRADLDSGSAPPSLRSMYAAHLTAMEQALGLEQEIGIRLVPAVFAAIGERSGDLGPVVHRAAALEEELVGLQKYFDHRIELANARAAARARLK